jgi:glucosamine-6-phosphate deaminase
MWLYRSKDAPYEAHEVEMAVPMSPDQVAEKIHALRLMQDVTDHERMAADRNRGLAATYDALGLAEYEAIEAFRRGLM